MDIDITRLDSSRFQRLCNDLLLRILPDMKPIDGSGGDDGVDSFIGMLKGELVIYQYKFFDGRLNSSRKKQIIDSFNTAKDKNAGMKEWTLMITVDFTCEEQKWFETELIEKNSEIKIDYWGKQKLESLICENDTLLEKYFSKSIMVAGKKAVKALSFLSDPPIKRIMSHADEMKKIANENPHLGMKYVVDSEKNQTNVTFDPKQPMEFSVKLKFPKEKFGDTKPDKLLDKINSGETIQFNEGEVEAIEFKDDEMKDLIPDASKLRMVIQPQYLLNEVMVSIEVPNSPLFYDDVKMIPIRMEGDNIALSLKNLPCETQMEFSKNTGVAKFNIKYSITGKPIFTVKRFMNFVDTIEKNKMLLIRHKDSGKTIMQGAINFDSVELIDPFSRMLVEKLSIIENQKHVSFNFPEQVTDNDYNYMLMASDLVNSGVHNTTIKDITLNITLKGIDSFLEKYHNEGDKMTGVVARYAGVKINIFGVEIPIGEVEHRLPKMKIINLEEVQEKIKAKEQLIGVVLKPVNPNDTMNVIQVKSNDS